MEGINADDALSYALAYVKRYQRDVPYLEREQQRLLAALMQVWHFEQYAHVIQLINGLSYLAGRLDSYLDGERLLRWGILACQQVQDYVHLARFLNRLSGLLCSRGEYIQAQQVWEKSLEVANSLGRPAYLWEPFSSFAHIADILGRYDAADRFAESLLHAHESEDQSNIAVALFVRGFYARLSGQIDQAHTDLNICLDYLRRQQSVAPAYECLFEMEVRTELARVQGDYTRAQEYTEVTVALGRVFCDPYTVAVLLWDEANFAYQQGFLTDAHALILRMVQVATRMGASHIYSYGMTFLQRFSEARQERLPSPPATYSSQQVPHTQLSKRELEVLQLAAAGLSNREIAEKLTITVGTVKKHLENIYSKLDAHSRTRAVAWAKALLLF
jgi:DNA-binding NarL/FixJ family response regulator